LSRLPVENLPARLEALDLSGTEVHHLPDWGGYDDPKRLQVIRSIAMQRGRDPRIASLAVDIIKKAGAKPREYKKQAAALLKWVQDPKNIYYVNEPGERLQDPIFTIKQGWGDCDDQVIVLGALFESIRLPWKLVIAGTNPAGKKVRHIEGARFPKGNKWAHIYLAVGVPPFKPKEWYFCETTVNKVPLGWDVVDGDKGYLPEMDVSRKGPAKLMKAPKARRKTKNPLPPPANRSPGYDMAYAGIGTSMGAAIGASMAMKAQDEGNFIPSSDPGGFDWDFNLEPGELKQEAKKALLDIREILPAVVTGVVISVLTQISLDWVQAKRSEARAAKGLPPVAQANRGRR
jgi:hypothetical protein